MFQSVVPMMGSQVNVPECRPNYRWPSWYSRVRFQWSAARLMFENVFTMIDGLVDVPECRPNDRQPSWCSWVSSPWPAVKLLFQSVIPMIGGQVNIRECRSNDRRPGWCSKWLWFIWNLQARVTIGHHQKIAPRRWSENRIGNNTNAIANKDWISFNCEIQQNLQTSENRHQENSQCFEWMMPKYKLIISQKMTSLYCMKSAIKSATTNIWKYRPHHHILQ